MISIYLNKTLAFPNVLSLSFLVGLFSNDDDVGPMFEYQSQDSAINICFLKLDVAND